MGGYEPIFSLMSEKAEGWAILISILVLSSGGYMIAWRSSRMWLRRAASLFVGAMSGVAALGATIGRGIPALGDFRDPTVSTAQALLEDLLLWSFCLAAWFVTARLLSFAFRKQQNS